MDFMSNVVLISNRIAMVFPAFIDTLVFQLSGRYVYLFLEFFGSLVWYYMMLWVYRFIFVPGKDGISFI